MTLKLGVILNQIIASTEEKSKIYIRSGQRPPGGEQTQRGPRGGIYYESGGKSRLVAETRQPKPVKPAPKLREPFKPFEVPFRGEAADMMKAAGGDWNKFAQAMKGKEVVFFDYETTGITDGNAPVQLGAVRMRDGQVLERFNMYMNPQALLGDWSKANLRGPDNQPLTDEFLASQEQVDRVHQAFVEFAGGSMLAAHNVRFDQEVLGNALKKHGIKYRPPGMIDTLSMAQGVIPKSAETPSHALGAMTKLFGIDLGDRAHSASDDSEATGMLMYALLDHGSQHGVSQSLMDVDGTAKQHNIARSRWRTQMAEHKKALGVGSVVERRP